MPDQGEPTKPICYFDTSALNHLHDDPKKDELLKKLASNYIVYTSVHNFIEFASTADKKRRMSLLFLLRKLSANIRPLDFPSALLANSLKAFATGSHQITGSICELNEGVWKALNKPKILKSKDLKEVSECKHKEEKWYKDMHDHGKKEMQNAIKGTKQITTPSKFIKHLYSEETHLRDFFKKCFVKIGYNEADFSGKELLIVKDLEPWAFYFAAMGMEIFNNAIKGKKWTPGSLDTQQAIYLACCNIFITADENQLRLLRSVRKLGHINRDVLSYIAFRERLLNTP